MALFALLFLVLPVHLASAQLAFGSPPPAACDADNGGLKLAPGFCATLYATLPGARHIAVSSNGDLFVAAQGRAGGLFLLRDRDGDGHADTTVTFMNGSGTGVAVTSDAVYFAPADQVLRFGYRPGSLAPNGPATVVVSGLPTGGHSAKTLAMGKDGFLFVDHGSATNSCQIEDRKTRSPGQQPCAELAVRAGIWRYDSRKSDQTPADGERWATGLRNAMAITVDPASGVLFGASHGRDQLGANWGFSDADNAEKPAEEFGMIAKGADLARRTGPVPSSRFTGRGIGHRCRRPGIVSYSSRSVVANRPDSTPPLPPVPRVRPRFAQVAWRLLQEVPRCISRPTPAARSGA